MEIKRLGFCVLPFNVERWTLTDCLNSFLIPRTIFFFIYLQRRRSVVVHSVRLQVAGSAYPYATIFTGGWAWRWASQAELESEVGRFRLKWTDNWGPISLYGTLDLPTYFLDLTPFVPMLTDGNSHAISLDVASAETIIPSTKTGFCQLHCRYSPIHPPKLRPARWLNTLLNLFTIHHCGRCGV